MSVSTISSSPLQPVTLNSSGPASSNLASPSSDSARLMTDTVSISPQAVQFNTNSVPPLNSISAGPINTTTLTAPVINSSAVKIGDTAQSPNLNQCHRHHHHHHGHEGVSQDGASLIDRLAQSIVADLNGARGTTTATVASAPTSSAVSAQASDGSLIDRLASAIAKQLLAQYQIPAVPTSAVSSSPSQVSAVA